METLTKKQWIEEEVLKAELLYTMEMFEGEYFDRDEEYYFLRVPGGWVCTNTYRVCNDNGGLERVKFVTNVFVPEQDIDKVIRGIRVTADKRFPEK